MVNKIRMFLAGLIACFFITSCGSDYDDVSVLNDEPSLSTDTLKTRSFEDGIDMILLSWRKIPSFDVNFDNYHRNTWAVFALAQMDSPNDVHSYLNLMGSEDIQMYWADDARAWLYDLWSRRGHSNPNLYLPNELKIHSYISNRYIKVGDIDEEVRWHTPYYLIMCMYTPGTWYCHSIYLIPGSELGGGAGVKVFELDEDAQPVYPNTEWDKYINNM